MMAEPLQPFLRLNQVKALVALSRSSIYERIRRGDFPRPVSIGARAVAWTSGSIAEWQARQIEAGKARDNLKERPAQQVTGKAPTVKRGRATSGAGGED